MSQAAMPLASSRMLRLLASVLLPLLLLSQLGMDDNWDLYNYHLYGPHAWWTGRAAGDIAAAQLQSFHNPLLDLPMYLMVQAGWNGKLIALWLALPFMLALYCLLGMLARLGLDANDRITPLALALMVLGGAAAHWSLGSSYNDAYVACGMLLALRLLMADDSGPAPPRRWLCAGLLAGAVAGLKLTAAMYCVGLGLAALFSGSPAIAARRAGLLLAGGLAGFLLSYGHWGWQLWQEHGNPVFPYFNQFFHSPDAMASSHADLRFRPRSLYDALLVPWRLLEDSRRHSEWLLRDPRLMLGLLAMPGLCWRSRRGPGTDPARANLRLVAVFFLVSLALWLLQYGIYRYLLPLEMLSCLLLALLVAQLAQAARAWIFALMLVLLHGATLAEPAGRTDFSRPMAHVEMPVLPPGSLVVTSSGSPLSAAALRLPNDIAIVAVHNNLMHPERCTGLQAQAEDRIRSQVGPLWLLREDHYRDDGGERLLARYGLQRGSNCYPGQAGGNRLRICQLHRRDTPRLCPLPATADRPR